MKDMGVELYEPSVSVIVCTNDRDVLLRRCLQGAQSLDYPNFEILVVDNAPSNQAVQATATERKVRYVQEPRKGLSYARNRGLQECDSEIVAFLDDDVVPDPRWLRSLVREFSDPRVMAVAPRQVPLFANTEAERLSIALGYLDNGGDERRIFDRNAPFWFEMANFGGIGNGPGMAVRKRACTFWPGFDVRQGAGAPIGGQEHYAFFSMIDMGYKVAYSPDAIVQHPHPESMEQLRRYLSSMLSASVGFLLLLLVEEPRYRGRTINYIRQALQGSSRPWRSSKSCFTSGVLSKWDLVRALFKGLFAYLSSIPTVSRRSRIRRVSPGIATSSLGDHNPNLI